MCDECYSAYDIVTEGMLPGFRLVVDRDYDTPDPREYGNFDADVNRAWVNGAVYTVSVEEEVTYVNTKDSSDTRTEWVRTGEELGECYLADKGEWSDKDYSYTALDVARAQGWEGVAPKEDDE